MRATIAYLPVIALLVAGCGGVGDETITVVHYKHEAKNAAVANAVFRYLNAVARADGKTACDWLTKQEGHVAVREARGRLPGLPVKNCADALTGIGLRLTPEARAAIGQVAVTNTRYEGDSAATVELVGGETPIRLIRGDNHWLVGGGGVDLWTPPARQSGRGAPSA